MLPKVASYCLTFLCKAFIILFMSTGAYDNSRGYNAGRGTIIMKSITNSFPFIKLMANEIRVVISREVFS